jgi:hypothetical protein
MVQTEKYLEKVRFELRNKKMIQMSRLNHNEEVEYLTLIVRRSE